VVFFCRRAKPRPFRNECAVKGRWLTVRDIGPFYEKHHVSLDWLLGGCLQGRLRMARKEVVPLPRPSKPIPEAVRQVLATLDEKERSAVLRVLSVLPKSTA
jgi:hypothetical protein